MSKEVTGKRQLQIIEELTGSVLWRPSITEGALVPMIPHMEEITIKSVYDIYEVELEKSPVSFYCTVAIDVSEGGNPKRSMEERFIKQKNGELIIGGPCTKDRERAEERLRDWFIESVARSVKGMLDLLGTAVREEDARKMAKQFTSCVMEILND